MFRHYRSGDVWGHDVARDPIDRLGGMQMEKQVAQLPEKHAVAVRWLYVYAKGNHKYKPVPVWKIRSFLGVTKASLADLIHDGRSMLNNRSKP